MDFYVYDTSKLIIRNKTIPQLDIQMYNNSILELEDVETNNLEYAEFLDNSKSVLINLHSNKSTDDFRTGENATVTFDGCKLNFTEFDVTGNTEINFVHSNVTFYSGGKTRQNSKLTFKDSYYNILNDFYVNGKLEFSGNITQSKKNWFDLERGSNTLIKSDIVTKNVLCFYIERYSKIEIEENAEVWVSTLITWVGSNEVIFPKQAKIEVDRLYIGFDIESLDDIKPFISKFHYLYVGGENDIVVTNQIIEPEYDLGTDEVATLEIAGGTKLNVSNVEMYSFSNVTIKSGSLVICKYYFDIYDNTTFTLEKGGQLEVNNFDCEHNAEIYGDLIINNYFDVEGEIFVRGAYLYANKADFDSSHSNLYVNNSIIEIDSVSSDYHDCLLDLGDNTLFFYNYFRFSSANFTIKFGKNSSLNGNYFGNKAIPSLLSSGNKQVIGETKIIFDLTDTDSDTPLILANQTTLFSLYQTTFEFIGNIESCVDVFSLGYTMREESVKGSFFKMYSNETHKLLTLSNNGLLRYCPIDDINNTVICKMLQDRYYYSNDDGKYYDYRHCPCNDDENTNCFFVPHSNVLKTPQSVSHRVNLTFTEPIETIQVGRGFSTQIMNGWFDTFNFFNDFVFTRKFDFDPNSVLQPMSLEENTAPFMTVGISDDELSYMTAKIEENEGLVMKQFETEAEFDFTTNVPYVLMVTQDQIKFEGNDGYVTFYFNNVTMYFEATNKTKVITKDMMTDGKFFCSETLFTGSEFKCEGVFYLTCDAGEFADFLSQKCQMQPDGSKKCFSLQECVACNDGYIRDNDQCVKKGDGCVFSSSDECRVCDLGYNLKEGKCLKCPDDCGVCESDMATCDMCYNSARNQEDNSCYQINGSEYYKDGVLVQCDNSHYLESGTKCDLCETQLSNCAYCDHNSLCTKCKNGFVFNAKNECVESHCKDVNCEVCEDGYAFMDNGTCALYSKKCKIVRNGICIDCENGNTLVDGECVETSIPQCKEYTTSNGCLICEDGYFNNNGICDKCDDNCKTCMTTSTNCLTCEEGTFVSEGRCSTNEALVGICLQYAATGGCVRCKEGYYRDKFSCTQCDSECETCLTSGSCTLCNVYNFMTFENTCKNKSLVEGCQGDVSSVSGCLQCSIGFYLYHKECYKCDESCLTCDSSSECLTCNSSVVYTDGKCLQMSQIEKCVSVGNSKCDKCAFWSAPNDDGTECVSEAVWWVILLCVFFVVILLVLLVVLTTVIINKLVKKQAQKKQEKNICVFKMKRSNISFPYEVNKKLVSNKSKLTFKDEAEQIPVGEESRELICFGNTSDSLMKVQITVKEGCTKYQIRSSPNIINLKKGEACEFEIYILPMCTSNTEDTINIISLYMKDGKPVTTPFKITVETVISTRLDYEDLEEEQKIGEGSFGIVYRGTYRGNIVAIKKMKHHNGTEETELTEFEKEIQMLDKFRSDFIVHFYGAVFIPSKICMVTEFAKFGSLHDLIRNKPLEPFAMKLRIKIMTDLARGVEYLHSNGILHRDIKPDNILVVSIEDDVLANGKLTDFGSSRNINMMMTNMTFTKGIGSPSYMSPEVLHQEKYKKAADVFSFAVTMYECLKWGEAYGTNDFKFPWKIAEFVNDGHRLPKTAEMSEDVYDVVERCWAQDAVQRPSISEVVKMLTTAKF
ncbi:protein serine/threonine kinase, putative [Entamoeba invadens IP1]|uniref:protein serine/threonine kinase, putative n=1 Tax=Entamoeba invadens IP1 TaxID=370355 RepID=UPI0002C3D157|nr:protein serine/threonine kinase, putative [Entamoeba invadens IP1]ELP85046.1 protein serine/threonine kinase, putative [Entamoeba invadens IP1]|eukprot:XP_004184392.1 protein serine/threonine kinase, putative [Entamoeba invadens IP1]